MAHLTRVTGLLLLVLFGVCVYRVFRPANNPRRPMSSFLAATSNPAGQSSPQALAHYQRGMDLYSAGKLLDARNELSAALLSGQLGSRDADSAVKTLTELAGQTLLRPNVVDGDPYSYTYTFRMGDLLNRVLKNEKVYLTPDFILGINGISDARSIRVGQSIKLIRGPVHAVVSKDNFTLDLYLHRNEPAGLPRAFLKRLSVGLGRMDLPNAAGGTPAGTWKVCGKMAAAPWTPPADHPVKGKMLRPGDPQYPLGKDGFWISLEGADENTRTYYGYGIHGTNEPESIGKAASSGCVRLADDDIRFVFSVLCDKLSTVEIRP